MNIKIKDPWSALTHFIGILLALFATAPLLVKAAFSGDMMQVYAMAVFMLSMVLLYAASATYHAFGIGDRLYIILKKIDHMMIPVLIAGTYTPICLITLKDGIGPILLTIVWLMAIISILVKAFWVTCPKWFSSLIYIAMGWVCILGMSNIVKSLSRPAFIWLLIGGILYTAGGVIYALKLPIFNAKHKSFGSHEVFHLFVMGGSMCHYIVMYGYVG
ncbi:MAG: hemolysin III family protein [Lachnospiraceae bacterium]|nr:hemolysin III family protein [Lachnospiraceae bacterium]